MNLTQKSGDLGLVGYQTKVLVKYPIAIDFKNDLYTYRWVGKDELMFSLGGYHPGDDAIVTVNKDGLFQLEDVTLYEPLTYSDPILMASSKWWNGLYKIIRRFEYDDNWWNNMEIFMNSDGVGLKGLCDEQFFWKTPTQLLPSPTGKVNKITRKISRKPRSVKGFMYAVQLDGFVKVGFSANVESRMSAYKTSSIIVDLICVEPATIAQELQYHKKYNKGSEKYDSSLRDSIHDSIKSHLS